MAQAYTAIPQGALFNIPEALPQGLLFRYKKISNLSRQNLKIPPNNGQSDVWAGQKIIVTLPPNALIDLSTFTMDFKGYTQHNGSAAVLGPTGYCQSRFFPRGTQSLIDTMEIKIGGQTRQLINNYGYIYNILNDFTTGTDATNKNRIGQNADPSCKYYYSKSGVRRRCGYPIGLISDPKSANDNDDYSIRNWIGFFQGSTSIIDTSMFGQIDLEITLAPAGVLMLGKKPENTALAAVAYDAATNEIGVDIPAATLVTTAIAAEGTSYKLTDISFSMVRYDLPKAVTDAMTAVLASGSVYQYWYPSYTSFMGQPVNGNKTGTTRISLSTSSLEMLIGTFMVQNRDTQSYPILGNHKEYYLAKQSTAEYGEKDKTFRSALQNCAPICFNQSKYFVRNGTTLKQCRWGIGNVYFNYETIPEQFYNVLKAFNTQNDTLGGFHEGLTGIPAFQDTYYAHILSLNAAGENDIYTVSGLDASTLPTQISWEYVGGEDVTNSSWDEIYDSSVNTIHTPLIIAVYSAHLDIMANRQIITRV
jgi:hypothetical protein